jgi:hypothetical protein
MFEGWSISETATLHSGLPFSVLSQPYIANGNGVFQANGASTVQFNAPATSSSSRTKEEVERRSGLLRQKDVHQQEQQKDNNAG